MNIFITGATGFLGGELLVALSKRKEIDKIYCLVRSISEAEANARIEHIFELHEDYLDKNKIIPVIGNLSDEQLTDSLMKNTVLNDVNIIIHSAANTSFSKIYDDLVERVNIDGLNQVLSWAKQLKNLETFLYIGTATICGKDIKNRIVYEDESPNLNANHLVKYTYTKMMGEINIHKQLPKEKILIARPSIIMGDSRPWLPRSTVILWALATVNMMRLVPVNPLSQLDIIPVDYASAAIIELLFTKRNHYIYHVSSGIESASNSSKITNVVHECYKDKPLFKFVDKSMISQMKNWARNRLKPYQELNYYSDYLDYWNKTFVDSGKLRMLFAGLEPYLDFTELGQVFDNSRLMSDIKIGAPQPVHEYIKNSIKYFGNIDVFEGAIDP
ncbi:MAG: SDR family oxidoreductase [Bacteroidales bacterium]|nr:SDR family oxidoreductase [Bacteroidales bacterium]